MDHEGNYKIINCFIDDDDRITPINELDYPLFDGRPPQCGNDGSCCIYYGGIFGGGGDHFLVICKNEINVQQSRRLDSTKVSGCGEVVSLWE